MRVKTNAFGGRANVLGFWNAAAAWLMLNMIESWAKQAGHLRSITNLSAICNGFQEAGLVEGTRFEHGTSLRPRRWVWMTCSRFSTVSVTAMHRVT